MEKNNHSNYSSRCRRIREALSNQPAFRAIRRFSRHHHESPRPSSPPLPQRDTRETHGSIPINFNYSTPESQKATKTWQGHGQAGKAATKVEHKRPQYVPGNAAPAYDKGKSKQVAQDSDQKYDKDMNYVFSEYIQRAREKLRTVSNIGKGQSKPAIEDGSNNIGGNKKKDNHRDQISDFIQSTKKKIRITSNLRNTGSLKRG